MTWMKYPVLAVTITAAGWGFLLVPPTVLAVTDVPHNEAIASDHGNGVHIDHHDHIDPEPDEIPETYRSDSYALPAWRPYATFVEYSLAFINAFREVHDQA